MGGMIQSLPLFEDANVLNYGLKKEIRSYDLSSLPYWTVLPTPGI